MIKIILIITVFLIIECLSNPVNSDQGNFNNVFKQINDSKSSAYINMVFCSAKSLPWDCVKEESTRLLDTWMNNLYNQWELLKVEADSQMNSTLQKRGYSVNKFKEKPSNMINKIKTGTNYIGELVSQTIDELMGRDMEENYSPIGENDEQKSIEAVSPRGEKDGIVNQMKSDSQNGSRGKKKKKKKALVKLMLWGTIIKGKIELLLKILSAHLQIKFFLIALVGLLINIARFWIDIKKSHSPQKVIYYEHAHHQHTYEDHGDDWNSEGSYWKRSLNGANDINVGEVPSNKGSLLNSKDHIYLLPQASQNDPQYLAYREQIQR
ncbi:hypothetical protein ACFFRR_005460 [Megaselia abdita]